MNSYCPHCRDAISGQQRKRCSNCGVPSHQSCFDDKGCPTRRCGEPPSDAQQTAMEASRRLQQLISETPKSVKWKAPGRSPFIILCQFLAALSALYIVADLYFLVSRRQDHLDWGAPLALGLFVALGLYFSKQSVVAFEANSESLTQIQKNGKRQAWNWSDAISFQVDPRQFRPRRGTPVRYWLLSIRFTNAKVSFKLPSHMEQRNDVLKVCLLAHLENGREDPKLILEGESSGHLDHGDRASYPKTVFAFVKS